MVEPYNLYHEKQRQRQSLCPLYTGTYSNALGIQICLMEVTMVADNHFQKFAVALNNLDLTIERDDIGEM